MTQLVWLLALISLVPGLILFALQSSLGGWDWFKANYQIGLALFFGQLLWCVVLALFGVAVSAWVKWKIAAGALLLGVYFAGAGFGVAINQILRTDNGSLINLSSVISTIWNQMFGIETGTGIGPGSAWIALAVFCGISVWLLLKRVRAFEVVR
jgi:ABC-2 type transport system permease protein